MQTVMNTLEELPVRSMSNSLKNNGLYSTGDVVVSGISCRLPEADNMEELRQNLFNAKDMVTKCQRWDSDQYGLPDRCGTVKDITKFDASFFGVHTKQAERMDPQLRILLEVAYESLIDAGIDPNTIRGSRTGVFVGNCGSEAHCNWTSNPETVNGYEMTGCAGTMLANRLSFFLDLKGPSMVLDTACSSSLFAFDQALLSIHTGRCDAAIVAGANILLRPTVGMEFQKLGMLSPEGMCKSFDDDGNGYCRSEGIVAIYLQKSCEARRVYCTVLHCKTNADGHKDEGITFPSGNMQKQLMHEVCDEAGVNPTDIVYMEAHGTGTKAGDPQETGAIADLLCANRKTPLLIGSTKSNLGHTEGASGLASMAKVLIAMEDGYIPGNLHYNHPNQDIPALVDGRLKVVTERTKLETGIIGLSSFGFGGSNVFALLKSPIQDEKPKPVDNSMRLFTYCWRTEEGLNNVLNAAMKNSNNMDFLSLLNETSHLPVNQHFYRGYGILNSEKQIEIQKCISKSRPVWYVFSGMGSQWHGMGRELMKLELFKKSIQLSDTYLKPHGVQVYNTIMGGDEKAFDNVTLAFIGIIAIQIAMVDVLACMGVRPDGLLGHSVGELGCAYADGAMTAKETLLTAYWRGRCIEEKQLAPGAMAIVGLTWDEAQLQSPENVVPACHNSEKLVTVSGNREAVERFVKDVSDKGIFCREVQSVGVAFHSPDMNQVAPMFKAKIEKVIVPKPRSPRWISTSIPKSEWGSELAKYSCADYYANNLVSPVLFHEALQTIPRNAIVIEISPHCLLHSILKRSMGPESLCVGLVDKKHGVTVEFFLTSLGKCYMAGMNFGPECHGPSKIYPVSKGTPMISPLLKWDHSRSWNIPKWDSYRDRNQEQNNMEFEVNLSPTSQFQYLKDHIIDGHALVPVAAHLIFAWQTLAKMTGQKYETMPVVWQDVQIHRPTFLPASGSIKFAVRIMDGSGHFEICESGYLVLSGRIFETEDGMEEHFKASVTTDDIKYEMSADDIYRELRIRGYDYAFDFKGILKSNITCDRGEVLWTGNWVTHLDTMLQMYILSFQDSLLRLPTRIKYLSIHPQKHRNKMYKIADGNIALDVAVNSKTKTVTAGGLVILGPHATVAERRSLTGSTIQAYHFVPCINKNDVDMSDSLVRYTNLCSVHAVKALQVCCKENGRINDIDHLCSDLDRLTTDTSTFSDVGTLFDQKNFGLFHTIRTFEKGDQCMQSHDDALLQRDILLTSLHQAETLKPILDIVVDNIAPDSIRALELEASISCMHSKVKDLLSLRSKFAVDYTSADTSLQNMNLAELEASGVETLEWKPTLLAPQYLRNMQLVLAINVLHKYDDLSKVMKNISTVMANGAFFLVQEVTRNFHIHLPVQLMSTDTSAMPLNNNRTWAMYNDEQKWQDLFEQENFEVISKKSDGLLSTLFLLRIRNCSSPSDQTILTIDNFDYDWVDLLKENMQRIQNQPDDSKLWLVVENTVNSGIVGLISCLRYETGGDKLRCIFNASLKTGEDFHLVQDSQIFQTLVKKDLTMNVYRDGSFGYFCHIPPSSSAGKQIPCKHAFVNLSRKGDLSSLRWFESPLKYYTEDTRSDMELCSVHYASLNFRDVMLATGKLPADALPRNLETRECILGMEFSGLDQSGRKVAGIVEAQALASTVLLENRFLVEVPDHWSMEEAATVPLAYATAYYSLVVRGHIRKEDTVLIHAGSGAVGQAAIAVALNYGCEIFTTVGSTEKREYLLTLFPQLTNDHIGNSRESKFEAEILNLTDGRGVDVVLNSLADDKLEASLRVLADHGRFLEIGKYDLSKNTPLGMAIFLKNISFHGILLDALFGENGRDWETVSTLLREGIQSGVVKPLKHTIFRKYDLESAFRFMARGLHIGKVLIQVIEDIDASGHALDSEILAFPKIYFSVRKSYIITGGLGGFGLEFAQWMLSRGARNLVLTSRSGVKTGYQARKLNKLRAHGATIEVSLRNISDTEDTKHLLEDASELGPVGGIFHMAGVLDIALLKNQSAAQYQKVCDPKIKGVLNLDHECRKQSVEAFDWFVVFSSYVASHGNAGQSNYGFANSAMERICEKRRSDGLAGLAIQWGAIGDVGMAVANSGSNNFEIAGTLPQRICSCISELDQLLNQPQPVIACYVKTDVSTKLADKSIKRDIVETVLKIIGVADHSSINPCTQFGDLGLDSLLGIELQQVLDADFGLVLSLREFRHLTPQGLEELANPKDKSHDDNQ